MRAGVRAALSSRVPTACARCPSRRATARRRMPCCDGAGLRPRARAGRQPLQLARRRARARASIVASPATGRRTRTGSSTSCGPIPTRRCRLGRHGRALVDGAARRALRARRLASAAGRRLRRRRRAATPCCTSVRARRSSYWRPERGARSPRSSSAAGYEVAWSAGPGEENARRASRSRRSAIASYAGTLDLAQLWHLLAGAALLVAPDTGVAHLGRLTLHADGDALRAGLRDACRAGRVLARRAVARGHAWPIFPAATSACSSSAAIDWVRRCQRTLAECAEPRCMHAIGVEQVLGAISSLGR